MRTDSDRTVLWIGCWASLLALIGALGYMASAILQVSGVLAYRGVDPRLRLLAAHARARPRRDARTACHNS